MKETSTELESDQEPELGCSSMESVKSPIPTSTSTTVSAEPHLFEDYDWLDLPQHIQNSFRALGYTQEIWDSDRDPESCDKVFRKLSPEEQAAARNIGYDSDLWDNEDDESSDDDSEASEEQVKPIEICSDESRDDIVRNLQAPIPENSNTIRNVSRSAMFSEEGGMKYGEVTVRPHYNHYDWKELPEQVKSACKVLNYTEEMWDTNQEPDTGRKDWDELTLEQQQAAGVLFYDAELWDNESDCNYFENKHITELRTNCFSQVSKKKCQGSYEEYYWRELPETVKKAAELLGYTEKLWNRDKDPKRCRRSWAKLSSEEQSAAMALGYNARKWDNDDEDCSSHVPISFYEDMDWDELPERIKAALKILGYTKDTWNAHEDPDSCGKKWNELCAEEQEAARDVGFDANAWNGTRRRIRKDITIGCKGSFYVLLDCLAMSAFFCIVDELFGCAQKYVGEFALNAIKIVWGLSVMFWNGQLVSWLDEDDEPTSPKKRRSKGRRKSMFNSFLNLLSWWSIYSGVNYFFDSFEDDYLHRALQSWYERIEKMAKDVFEGKDAATPADDFTCADLQQHGATFLHRVVGGMMCEWSEENWGIVSQVYYAMVFLASALGMFWFFEDNFLESCDEM
eukprot:scaffold4887_cov118-Cylindrotheca_fusiformis.AAC.2